MELYFNNASTTQPDEGVIADFVYCAKQYWHNPSDVSQGGLAAKEIIENAQKQIAASINAKPEEIIFTSGGSESNNWAIKGYVDKNNVNLILTTKIEHPSVYNTCLFCREHGVCLDYIRVNCLGMVDIAYLEQTMRFYGKDCKTLVSIMFSNNEIGTIQPIKEIAEIVHKYGGILHVDAVQAYMHSPIDVQELGIDMMSTSFHKFGGFKNCGFLYVKNGIELTPLIHGGHQFDSKRSGTENVPMIYAMGNQVEKLSETINERSNHLRELYYYFLTKFFKVVDIVELDSIRFNGDPINRAFNNISLTIAEINADVLIDMMETKGIYISAGSACCAGEKTPSRILKAIGLSDNEAFSTVRISMDDHTTIKEVTCVIDALIECIKTIKEYEIE